ncbi:MAG: hypothetical protein PHT99_02410, partial [Methanoregula sp.]|nr:hypothetical protein [Methanoregula sp.]
SLQKRRPFSLRGYNCGKGVSMTPSGPLGRDAMAFREKMVKYRGEIERLVYAAEILCHKEQGLRECMNCAFNIRISEPICPVEQLRYIVGDHVIQRDIPQEPPQELKETTACPRCGEPDYNSKPLGAYSGGGEWVSCYIECRKCGKDYWNRHRVPSSHMLPPCQCAGDCGCQKGKVEE